MGLTRPPAPAGILSQSTGQAMVKGRPIPRAHLLPMHSARHTPGIDRGSPPKHLLRWSPDAAGASSLRPRTQVKKAAARSTKFCGRQVESSDLESQLQYGGFIAVRRFHIGVWANDFPCPQCLHDRDPCPPNRPRLGSKKQTRRGKHPMRLFGLTRRRCAD